MHGTREARAGARRPSRMSRRMLALVAASGITAVVAVVMVTGRLGSDASADAASEETATATVARRDLVQRSSVSGILGYDDTRQLVSSRQGTITGLPEEGSVLSPGAVLYRVDERPIVLLAGSVPAWRPLGEGVSKGRDVRQLEQNLRALGYDDDLDIAIDERFDASTAAAVERWQVDLGVEATGRIELGDVVFLTAARRIGSIAASLGDRVRPGMLVLATSSTRRLVTAAIDAGDQQDVAARDKVTIDLRNGTTTTGTITEVGKVASDAGAETGGGQMSGGAATPTPSTITFEVRPDRPGIAGSLDQAPVDVGVTSERAKNVLSVPVSALLALRGGRYGVEVVRGETTSVVEVTPGLYSDGGYVEIKRGAVKAGDVVVVPA